MVFFFIPQHRPLDDRRPLYDDFGSAGGQVKNCDRDSFRTFVKADRPSVQFITFCDLVKYWFVCGLDTFFSLSIFPPGTVPTTPEESSVAHGEPDASTRGWLLCTSPNHNLWGPQGYARIKGKTGFKTSRFCEFGCRRRRRCPIQCTQIGFSTQSPTLPGSTQWWPKRFAIQGLLIISLQSSTPI